MTPAQQLAAKTTPLDNARANILPRAGANSYDVGAAAIAALPQADATPLDKVLLQAPGFSQDSAAAGTLHVRNEHANIQYRLNGIFLPDGVSGFGQVLDSGLIGNIAVLDGALPAQYGLHTAGVVDIMTKSGAFDGGGSVSLYGGSHQTITPSFEYGGTVGDTQYFVTGRYFGSNEGLENPMPSVDVIHDHSDQGKFFGYVSTLLGDGGRLSFISGTSVNNYQIPNVPGMAPSFTVPGVSSFDSSQLNEHQFEQNYFNVAAFQQTIGNVDYQISAFSRYSSLHSLPIRSAISSSTASPRTSSAPASSTVCKAMPQSSSTRQIHCGSALWAAASRRRRAMPPSFFRSTRTATSTGRRSPRRPMPFRKPAGSSASMRRTSGRSPAN